MKVRRVFARKLDNKSGVYTDTRFYFLGAVLAQIKKYDQ